MEVVDKLERVLVEVIQSLERLLFGALNNAQKIGAVALFYDGLRKSS